MPRHVDQIGATGSCSRDATEHRKLFQVQFARRDGSVFVSFPYFSGSTGVASLVQWPPDTSPTTLLSLEPGGKVTSHLVKYSHHPNGRAHFSQDRRVRTVVQKMATPLADLEGKGFAAGTEAEKNSLPTKRRDVVRFVLDDPPPASIKFVARLHSAGWLERRAVGNMVEPRMNLVQPDGSVSPAFAWSSPIGSPAETRCLLISIHPVGVVDVSRPASLVFIGGFDSSAVMNDPTVPA